MESTVAVVPHVSQALVRSKPGNVLVSPVSVSILLAMLQQGSLARSRDQLSSVLHVQPSRAREGYGHIVRSLKVCNGTLK